MERGEVWWVNFDPSLGGEIQKLRPAVIVSNDVSNKVMNRVQVIPITSQVEKCFPCEAYVTVNGRFGKAMADQLTTASKQRFKQKMGRVSHEELFGIEQAIKLQLSLS
jgi:mRNA interferase MazF